MFLHHAESFADHFFCEFGVFFHALLNFFTEIVDFLLDFFSFGGIAIGGSLLELFGQFFFLVDIIFG